MNLKTTLILAVFAVLLSVGISLVVLYTPERREELAKPDDTDVQSLLTDVPARADALTVESPGKPAVSARRDADQWQITAPVQGRGSYQWDSLYSALRSWSYRRSFKPTQADYPPPGVTGLDKPRLTVRVEYTRPSVDDAGPIRDAARKLGAPITSAPAHAQAVAVIRVGQRTPLGDGTYVALDAGETPTVYLIPGDVLADLKFDLPDLRSRDLSRARPEDIRELRFEQPGQPTVVLRRDSRDQWELVQPWTGRADAAAVNRVLNQASALTVDAWVPAGLGEQAFGSPRRVTLVCTLDGEPVAGSQPTTRPTRTISVEIGGDADLEQTQVFARMAGDQQPIGRIARSAVDVLSPKASDLRARTLVGPDTAGVEAIELASVDGRINLNRQGGQWQMTHPDSTAADESAVSGLLGQLSKLSAANFVPPQTASGPALPPMGLDQPWLTVRLTSAGASQPAVLKIGAADPSGAFRFAQLNNEGPVLVAADDVDALARSPLAYAQRNVWSFDRARVLGLTLSRADGEHVLRAQGGGWRLSGPAAQRAGADQADGAAAEALLTSLCALRASAVVGRSTDPAWKFEAKDQPLRIAVELPGSGPAGPALPTATQASQPASGPVAPQTLELTLARRGNDTLVRVEGQPYVYRVSDQLWTQAQAELADRRLNLGEPLKITRIAVQPPGDKPYVLVRGADGAWKVEGNELFPLDAARVNQLLKALGDARATSFTAEAFTPADKPASVAVTAGEVTRTLELGATTKLLTVAKVSGRDKPVWIDAGQEIHLTPALRDLAAKGGGATPAPGRNPMSGDEGMPLE